MGYFTVALLSASIVLGSVSTTNTQRLPVNQCGPYTAIAKQLIQKYKERPTVIGIIDRARHMQTWTTANGSTWTILIVHASGQACIVFAGQNLELIPNEIGEPIRNRSLNKEKRSKPMR